MRRAVPPVLLCLLLLPACDEEPQKGGTVIARTGDNTRPPKPPPVLPTTGAPQIRAQREDLTREIEQAEKDLEKGTKPAEHVVWGWKKLADNLIVAEERAVAEETTLTLRNDLSALRDKQGQLDKARDELGQSIQQLEQYLTEIEGGGRPPEGFTEDELKDRHGKRLEEMRALEKEEAEVRARMQEKEELLSKGNLPPQGRTLHTQELEALKQLKDRIAKLEARLK
jgi:phage shock protein A